MVIQPEEHALPGGYHIVHRIAAAEAEIEDGDFCFLSRDIFAFDECDPCSHGQFLLAALRQWGPDTVERHPEQKLSRALSTEKHPVYIEVTPRVGFDRG
jgi:hypothetical protein